MQTYPGLVTFFYQFFLHFKEGKIWCLVSSLADSPFGFLVLQIFPVERRENFHSRLCKTVQQPVAVVQESICAPKGFFVWLLVYSLCRCREYGPLVRSFGCRCKLKLPVWCLAESWIWCVHQSHHHKLGQLLHQGTCETPDALSCWRL